MAETLKQMEYVPLAFPPAPTVSAKAAALVPEQIWARIESYTAHRFTERGVKWIIEGPGEWCFPLTPIAAVTSVEIWTGEAWAAVTLPASPLGGYELGNDKYRINANVGSGSVPAPINEAFKRLAEYYADSTDKSAASDYSFSLGTDLNEAYSRPSNWMARAMQLSGAADLLRPYRRA